MFKYRDPILIILMRMSLATVFILSGLSGFMDTDTLAFFQLNGDFVGNIAESPHFYILKMLELVVGFALLANLFVQTALFAATPILLSAILYHMWIGTVGAPLTVLILIPLIGLIYFYRKSYYIFFKPQLYTNHMAEDTPKVLIYDEVRETKPKLVSKFEELYQAVNNA